MKTWPREEPGDMGTPGTGHTRGHSLGVPGRAMACVRCPADLGGPSDTGVLGGRARSRPQCRERALPFMPGMSTHRTPFRSTAHRLSSRMRRFHDPGHFSENTSKNDRDHESQPRWQGGRTSRRDHREVSPRFGANPVSWRPATTHGPRTSSVNSSAVIPARFTIWPARGRWAVTRAQRPARITNMVNSELRVRGIEGLQASVGSSRMPRRCARVSLATL